MREVARSALGRDMFLTQPPSTALGLEVSTKGFGTRSRGAISSLTRACMVDQRGITLRDIADVFERMIGAIEEKDGSLVLNFYFVIKKVDGDEFW